MSTLERLLRPRTVCVVGGGAWCTNVIRECRALGFSGQIWPVHPTRSEVCDLPAFKSVDALPDAPDATFIGVNRHITVEIVQALRARGAGGAVCFASGFQESVAETGDGADLQLDLLDAAGDMPILGPNCYGFINGLDKVALWPDQHGMVPVAQGVAIITQSSNIGLNLTMQQRGLPIAYLMTAGNQAQTDLADIGMAMLDDPRVTALGLHIEGIGDLRRFEAMADKARKLSKPIIALKVGASEQARAATVSHTASLAGSDAGARALFRRLGVGHVESLGVFLEALKLLHAVGPLASNRIASMSCSGGEASLMADSVVGLDVAFPPLDAAQKDDLREALGPKVALANPLDYHTYIWGDAGALYRCFRAMMTADLALGCVVLDFPRPDRCDATEWSKVVDAVAKTKEDRGIPMAILASLPETMPEGIASEAISRGIAPVSGLSDGLKAIECAAWLGQRGAEVPAAILLPGPDGASRMLDEDAAKAALACHGLRTPKSHTVASSSEAGAQAVALGFPVALKGTGIAHKTEAGAVALNLQSRDAVEEAAMRMDAAGFIVEEMITDVVVELLIGVVRDPAHGFVLTLGAGGTFTELLRDTTSRLLPVTPEEIKMALAELRIGPVLNGYRGKPAADMNAIVAAVLAIQSYVQEHAADVYEVEVNPLICQPHAAIAVDALIRLREDT